MLIIQTITEILQNRDILAFSRYYKTTVNGSGSGILAGKKVALKDNVALAGVPMMVGSRLMEGYMPEFDATIVTRILDAGNCSCLYPHFLKNYRQKMALLAASIILTHAVAFHISPPCHTCRHSSGGHYVWHRLYYVSEGGVIVGKAVCEDLCRAGSSFTTANSPVLNPADTRRSAGGSSSGCAALVSFINFEGRV